MEIKQSAMRFSTPFRVSHRLPTSSDFRELDLRSFYSATGQEIFGSFVYPVLMRSVSYDRLTGYFSVSALVAAAQGLEGLFRNGGRMRLVIGMHDVPEELLSALMLGNLLPIRVVEEYKARVIEEVGFLKEQAERNAISSIGWMMRSGLLEVRVAAPRSAKGIYHQKRMIFTDGLGNVIAGTGSLNETFGGQGNIEEMQFNFSWLSSPALLAPLISGFDDIWEGNSEEIEIFPLDEEFASAILSRLGEPSNSLLTREQHIGASAHEILELARLSPLFTPFNVSSAAFYPHQERVLREALGRWPVRIMLADEVGLGKTLEGGAVISYMLRFGGLESVTILAPAGLLRQWQEEMAAHFGLNFWRWDSRSNSYVGRDGQVQSGGFLGHPATGPPNLRLVSSQWARIHEESLVDSLPQMLLVDEAHAARVQVDQYGTRTTKLWNLLSSLKDLVPHIVLMTATPMQVEPAEYHGLLRILGLAPEWADFDNYMTSLRLISKMIDKPSLQDGAELADLILASVSAHEWLPAHLTEEELARIEVLRDASRYSTVEKSVVAQESYVEYRRILMKIHPAHFLTSRNTKSGLQEFGYKFPRRTFHAPAVAMEGLLGEYETAVEMYLTNGYGSVEAALRPHRSASITFAKSGYYQRMVSSFHASKMSLLKRSEKIARIQLALASGDMSPLAELFDDAEDESEDLTTGDAVEDFDMGSLDIEAVHEIIARVDRAAKLELSWLNDLLLILNSLGQDVVHSDPKFKVAIESLSTFVSDCPVLVFSRYRATLDGFLTLFEENELSGQVRGYALYTGQQVWIQDANGRREAAKIDVTSALAAGVIEVVFCSDAASEGLNLQSAQCIINLDVPWNPARLEQRIGRIARLGQKAEEVQIVNLWYPKSIEAKMYSRLLERRDDYELAVGEFPEIFSSAIAEEVGSHLGASNAGLGNPLVELQELRNSSQRIALEAVWQVEQGYLPPSQTFRDDLVHFITLSGVLEGTGAYGGKVGATPGDSWSVSLWHGALDEAVKVTPKRNAGVKRELVSVLSGLTCWGFGLRLADGSIRLLASSALPRLLGCALGLERLIESDFGVALEPGEASNKIPERLLEEAWLPRHLSSRVPYSGAVPDAPTPITDSLRIKSMGMISVGF